MMKDILVLSDGGPQDEVRFRHAEKLADFAGAELTVLMMNRIASSMPVVAPAMAGATYAMALPLEPDAETQEAWLERQAETEHRFASRKGKVRLLRLDDTAGGLAENVARLARTKDLVVASLPPGEGLAGKVLDQILVDSGRGVLGIPKDFEGDLDLSQVAIAWNGTRESARAMHEAMPVLREAKAVAVIIIDQLRKAGEPPPDTIEICRHLATNGVEAKVASAASGELATSEAILAEATRIGARLLVAGAQGAGGLIQWLRGSVSRDLLSKSRIPILMAH